MASSSSILSSDRGRASAAAWSILCLLAVVQAALIVRVLVRPETGAPPRPEMAEKSVPLLLTPPLLQQAATSQPAPTTSLGPPPVGQLAPVGAPPAVPAIVSSPGMGPPPIGSFEVPGGRTPPSGTSSGGIPRDVPGIGAAPPQTASAPGNGIPAISKTSLPGAASSGTIPRPVRGDGASVPPKAAPTSAADMSVEELVELAKQVRGLEDMQGALDVLKRADLQYPNKPAVLAEMAQCYEQMGLKDKATALWKQVESMDPARAAGFTDLAKRRLSAPAASASASGSGFSQITSATDSPKILTLGACQAMRDPAMTNGEKVTLHIPILRQGNSPVDPAQVDIDVYFFDRVNGEKIAQTIADEPLTSWSAAPVDWIGIGEEPVDVIYFMPPLTPGEVTAHGRRSYHGYVVKLYYQHKLQDVAAEPRDLLDFGSPAPALPGAANPLLPPVPSDGARPPAR